MKLRLLMAVLAFATGILVSNMFTGASGFETVYRDGFELPQGTGNTIQDLEMPQDRVREDQINVYRDRIILDIQGAQWSTFTPTKSMVPFLDEGANAIQVQPEEGCTDIKVGDIISYEPGHSDGIIIHRVIDTGEDKEGTYFLAKGDNNPSVDPGKIRCGQIKRVLVAIIY